MPKKNKTKITAPKPAKLDSSLPDPVTEAGVSTDSESYRLKNARAKELIMSTLIPESESWRIAESLEHASDIWKAIEARYIVTASEKGKDLDDRVAAVASLEQIAKKQNPMDQAQHNSSTSTEDRLRTSNNEATSEQNTQARAIQEFYESMPNSNQRLLWALLHGGKPETEAWFNGSATEA